MNEVLFNNANYNVVKGFGTSITGGDAVLMYLVVNAETTVTEAQTSILPQAITWAKDFNATLEELAKVQEDRPIFEH